MQLTIRARLASVFELDFDWRGFFTERTDCKITDYKVRQTPTSGSIIDLIRQFSEIAMLRPVKIFLSIPLAALIIFATNCGNDHSKVRVVNVSPDAGGLDVAVDGKTVVTDVAFAGISPANSYLTVTAGNHTVEFRDTGTTTDRINSNIAFASKKEYTLLAVGKVNLPPPDPPPPSTIAALLKTDDNSAPTSGNIKLRVIHASEDGPAHIDIFVVAPGTDITDATPTIASLAYQQASDYQNLAAGTYEVIMTNSTDLTHGTRIVDQQYSLTAGQIRTLVTLDTPDGTAMSDTPLKLSDLN